MRRNDLEYFAELVTDAGRIAVLTGAGISTASGIPDFRSPSGIYATRDANVFDIGAFKRDPKPYYDFAREFYTIVAGARPNSAHRILAKWEKEGKAIQIATQNIDDLHQRAGSTHVYPVHGTVLTSTCQSCGRVCETKKLVPAIMAGGLPICACGGVFKPDITFFGELLPEDAWEKSVRAMSEAELVLVLGTSLVVYPAASLPDYRSSSTKLAIINRDPTHLDHVADFVCHADLPVIFERVDALL